MAARNLIFTTVPSRFTEIILGYYWIREKNLGIKQLGRDEMGKYIGLKEKGKTEEHFHTIY